MVAVEATKTLGEAFLSPVGSVPVLMKVKAIKVRLKIKAEDMRNNFFKARRFMIL